ncbi:selenide, water dikinase SelD [Variovorax sp. PCZ-1]|uniref:selenide, water dikinase SelD n=1 Tax=Variovorax sp. PCZ-1 TaxID=2835533 RepID=UPI001BCA7612|nr:selenide, water dikinase SelD [Variovorax sp. PCZ-1]MBS7807469.1 selenide, water dikinase SelD [Variovorax sp. PCZ-1]
MQTSDQPILRDIVLIGGGHSHVGVLKSFGMNPIPGVRLTLICTDLHTPYSGMLPGYVAGHYEFDEVHIDLLRLAQFAGARVYRDEVIGIDRGQQKVLCKSRPAVPYDQLSINIGSTPQLQGVPGATEHAVAVKPIRNFNDRWLQLLERVKNHAGKTTIAVVGAGAGGVELLLAMQFRLRNELTKLYRNPDELTFHLLSANETILPTHNARVRETFSKALRERGVQVHLSSEVTQVQAGKLITSSGKTLDADEIIWVTRAGGAAWLKQTGLQLDKEGFIEVKDTLQTVTDPLIYAAGDIASMVNYKLEKAGVFAVRMGKPLTENLRRAVGGTDLQAYSPQTSWLALISTGDKYAVASRGWLGFAGAWVWQWKDWIDQRFMRKFSEFPDMSQSAPAPASNALANVKLSSEESLQAISAIAMRCGGCGAKVGATILQRALGNLHPVQRDDVLIGLKDPDDAAVVRVPPGMAVVHSVDFFRAFVDDPYIFGKVAANHSLGDIWAMGGIAQSATAVCTVPPGMDAKVEDVLFQMMTGALEVLNEADCSLVGGHTGEGKELALGFAVNGLIEDKPEAVLRKGGMKPGDVLILTKPIGTGTLFAAKDRLFAKGRWIDAALTSMVISNRTGAKILREHGATACTDLTGFGLLGHLVEMTRPSEVDAEIHMGALPLLDGAQECVQAGITSSLQSANVRLRRALRNQEQFVNHPRYPLIFDPQTAGGLLASVPAEQVDACIEQLKAQGYPHTTKIGRILPQGDALEPIVLVD